MASSTTEILGAYSKSESSGDGEELRGEELVDSYREEFLTVSQYVKFHKDSPNTKVFSFLALLNAYVPESYLLMCQCQEILGPPDPIHGGPPFEERMKPFTVFIERPILSTGQDQHVCMVHPAIAQASVQLLADLGVTRSGTVKNLMSSLSGHQNIIQFIKDLLTKREMGEKGRDKFSRLIEDIREKENFQNAVSVLSTASGKFTTSPLFPQTLSRLYYTTKGNYVKAEEWAMKAIERAPSNSYVADTLGQVHKNHLMREAWKEQDVLDKAENAIKAFKAVEEKAEKEEGPEMEDAGLPSVSNSFNNRGLFGYIQVAKIVFEKLGRTERGDAWRKVLTGGKQAKTNPSLRCSRLISNLKLAVIDKFDFFEWYLTYSKPDIETLEPSYFWKDIVLCYEYYTTKLANQSTSFPGLLDCLYHGLSTSKGSHAEFEEAEKTASDLEAIRDDLKTSHEANVADVQRAERYILSNIILSNKTLSSPTLTLEKELKMIINKFLVEEVRHRSPEFYLLVLLLFWPEEEPLLVQEEDGKVEEQQAAEDDGSEEDKDNDEEQETRGETAHPPSPDLMLDLDLNECVSFMKESFENKYGKYLRGRYLLPLFFLGKGSGLSRWVHRSRLDAILEANGNIPNIDEMWSSGKVWEIPEIQDILLPVRAESCSPMMPQEHVEQEVFACIGGKRIKVTTEDESNASILNPGMFYLGFTIQGPLAISM